MSPSVLLDALESHVKIVRFIVLVGKTTSAKTTQDPSSKGITRHYPSPSIRQFKNPMRSKIFISYSRLDEALLRDFKTMLAPLHKKGMIDLWDDTRIQAGTQWRQEIEAALVSANIAVLLVSPHFLASDFITGNELPNLLQAAENNELTIFWVLLNHCLVEETEIVKYQAAHETSKPIESLSKSEQTAVWANISRKLRDLANPQ